MDAITDDLLLDNELSEGISVNFLRCSCLVGMPSMPNSSSESARSLLGGVHLVFILPVSVLKKKSEEWNLRQKAPVGLVLDLILLC